MSQSQASKGEATRSQVSKRASQAKAANPSQEDRMLPVCIRNASNYSQGILTIFHSRIKATCKKFHRSKYDHYQISTFFFFYHGGEVTSCTSLKVVWSESISQLNNDPSVAVRCTPRFERQIYYCNAELRERLIRSFLKIRTMHLFETVCRLHLFCSQLLMCTRKGNDIMNFKINVA